MTEEKANKRPSSIDKFDVDDKDTHLCQVGGTSGLTARHRVQVRYSVEITGVIWACVLHETDQSKKFYCRHFDPPDGGQVPWIHVPECKGFHKDGTEYIPACEDQTLPRTLDIIVEFERYVRPEKREEFRKHNGVPMSFRLDIESTGCEKSWETDVLTVEHSGILW